MASLYFFDSALFFRYDIFYIMETESVVFAARSTWLFHENTEKRTFLTVFTA